MICESCHGLPATVFVRFHGSTGPTFQVCDMCAELARGATATILGPVEVEA